MNSKLIFEIVAFVTISLFVILRFISQGIMSLKYGLIWIFAIIIIFISVIIPDLMFQLSRMLGFKYLSSLLIAIFIIILMGLNISLTIIVSRLKNRIIILTQELAIVKKDIYDKK